jgi:hypothetical protein
VLLVVAGAQLSPACDRLSGQAEPHRRRQRQRGQQRVHHEVDRVQPPDCWPALRQPPPRPITRPARAGGESTGQRNSRAEQPTSKPGRSPCARPDTTPGREPMREPRPIPTRLTSRRRSNHPTVRNTTVMIFPPRDVTPGHGADREVAPFSHHLIAGGFVALTDEVSLGQDPIACS